MTKKIIRTVIPIAPNEYDQVYVNQLARALDRLIDEVRESNINVQGLSEEGDANTLQEGDLFIGANGFVKIVEQNKKFSGSVSGTTALGSVTVSIT